MSKHRVTWEGRCPCCDEPLTIVEVPGEQPTSLPPTTYCPYCGGDVCFLHDGVFADERERELVTGSSR